MHWLEKQAPESSPSNLSDVNQNIDEYDNAFEHISNLRSAEALDIDIISDGELDALLNEESSLTLDKTANRWTKEIVLENNNQSLDNFTPR